MTKPDNLQNPEWLNKNWPKKSKGHWEIRNNSWAVSWIPDSDLMPDLIVFLFYYPFNIVCKLVSSIYYIKN